MVKGGIQNGAGGSITTAAVGGSLGRDRGCRWGHIRDPLAPAMDDWASVEREPG
jgi:hypothetical protein